MLRKRYPPKSLRIHHQVQNDTQIRGGQKVISNDKEQLVVKNYSKNKQSIIQQPKFKPTYCPSRQRNNWLEVEKDKYCQNCEYIFNNHKHQIDMKVLRQEHYFPTRLTYANEKTREKYYSMSNTFVNQQMI